MSKEFYIISIIYGVMFGVISIINGINILGIICMIYALIVVYWLIRDLKKGELE